MEEYFAPHGTDHQILDGREARWRSSFLLIGVIAGSALLLGSLIWAWWWQRTVTFSVPNEAVTVVATPAGRDWLQDDSIFPTPTAWKAVRENARILGGTWTHPTWMIVPRWTRAVDGWKRQEAHGLYQLLVQESATSSVRAVALRDRRDWKLDLHNSLFYGTIQDAAQSFSFTFNGQLLVTSLTQAPAPEMLPTGFDGAILVQVSTLTQSFLSSGYLVHQGLAPWRSVLHSFAWNAPTGTISGYDARFTTTTSSLGRFLASSSTTSFVRYLQDGSISARFVPEQSSSSVSITSNASNHLSLSCNVTDFVPFFRLQGESLRYTWSRIASNAPPLLEIGSLGGRLTACFVPTPSVDK